MNYKVFYSNPQQHFIDIEFSVDVRTKENVNVYLPAWRPGRYELGNFAKNIQKWQAYNELGEELKFVKSTKDCWLIETKSANTLVVKYNYYANELNAGSTYLDENQLYINPVNCFLFLRELQNEKCNLELIVPSSYNVATGLMQNDNHKFCASSFHELVDSPLIASDNLQHKLFDCKGVKFNLWFQGESKPDFTKIIGHFTKFTEKQIEIFGEFPVKEYHYLFHILPYPNYHGVEHHNSTVIALGPTYDLMDKSIYNELLGVSCHELFHTWNIKAIRPKEMFPYNYCKENYSTLGYVAEGVTTYYGDLLLHRSDVFNDEEFFKLFASQIQKHLDNFARFTYSVAQSSFDTWLDGYVKGIPNRKLSIYSDGFLISFMLDILIIKNSGNKKSLDTVMHSLYHDFAKKDKGYTDKNYLNLLNKISDTDLTSFFNYHVFEAHDYTPKLKECLESIGLEIILQTCENDYETSFGFKALPTGEVTDVYPESLADLGGLAVGDKITHINAYYLDNNLAKWCKFFDQDEIKLVVQRKFGRSSISLKPTAQRFYQKVVLRKIQKPSKQHQEAFEYWKRRK